MTTKTNFKKSSILLMAVLFLCTFIFTGCADAVQDDLINYYNVEIPKFSDLDDEISELYNSAREDDTVDDYTFYTLIETEILPKSQELTDIVEAISPATEDVRNVHEIYISAINKQHNAFVKILSALENQDYAEVSEANELLDESRSSQRQYLNELDALADAHNVVDAE